MAADESDPKLQDKERVVLDVDPDELNQPAKPTLAEKMAERALAFWLRGVEREVRRVLKACQATLRDREGGPERVGPAPFLVEHAIRELRKALEDGKRTKGRPASGAVNGPLLHGLRIEAGMTQQQMVDAVRAVLGAAKAFTARTLRRYENSEAGNAEYLTAIALVLSQKLRQEVKFSDLVL